jgi:hypothetical protein
MVEWPGMRYGSPSHSRKVWFAILLMRTKDGPTGDLPAQAMIDGSTR